MSFDRPEITDLNEALGCTGIKRPYIADIDELDSGEVLDPDMRFESVLECIENWASENDMIDSEEELVRFLTRYFAETMDFRLAYTLSEDDPQARMIVSAMVDDMSRGGELHEEQRVNYDAEVDFREVMKIIHNRG